MVSDCSPKISVIIPAYNAERSIRKCLDSVVSQTLTDIEIIVVNDASTDKTEKIVNSYSKADDRILLVSHRENKGLLQARISGINQSKGRYIQHLDADDWIDHDACEIIYNSVIRNTCDLCHVGIELHKNDIVVSDNKPYFNVYDEKISNAVLLDRLINSTISHSAVAMISERSLALEVSCKMRPIHGLTVGEDMIYTFLLAVFGKKCICIPKRLYHYKLNIGTCSNIALSHVEFVNYFSDIITAIKTIEKFIVKYRDLILLQEFRAKKKIVSDKGIVNSWNKLSAKEKDRAVVLLQRKGLDSDFIELLRRLDALDRYDYSLPVHFVQRNAQRNTQYKIINSALVRSKLLSDSLLDRIHWWVPPVSGYHPPPEQPASSLRVAAMVDERLFRGLRFEVDLLLLTPDNWRWILAEGEIDFLLVESCWQTVTGHWYMGQCFNKEHAQEVLAIVSEAGKRAIPTVYWNTWDHLYHSCFSDFARNFDVVFCADPVEIELLGERGIKAYLLPPAIQPKIHNNQKILLHDQTEFFINVLFDGFVDIDRLGDELSILEEIRPYGLQILESQAQIFTSRVQNSAPLLQQCFLGSVSYYDWLTTVQHSDIALFLESTQRSKTAQQWQAIEAAACGAAVLHYGHLDENDIRKSVVTSCQEKKDLLMMTEAHLQGSQNHSTTKGKDNGTSFEKYTFAKRLKDLCYQCNINI